MTQFKQEEENKIKIKMPGQKKICIVGSGNWGSAIAKIIGENVRKHSDQVSYTNKRNVNYLIHHFLTVGFKVVLC